MTMSDDLIKRSDAIGACAYETIECYEARKAIRALPSADRPSAVDLSSVYSTAYKSGYEKGKADRPQGEWIDYKDEHTCSVCKEVVIDDWYYEYEWYDFCPHCGASMKGADDE